LPARGDEDRTTAEQRRQGHSRHLPVPIETGVDEIGDVRAERRRHERVSARLQRGDEWDHERGEKERQPDDAELGERLEVEVMSVSHDAAIRPVLEPVPLVRPRP
jgi:hypothetical protein